MPLKAWLATKHHFWSIPGGHSLHTKSISWEGAPVYAPRTGTSCVLGSLPYIYQSCSLVRNLSVTELRVVSGDNERIPGFLKSSRCGPLWLALSFCQDRGRELLGSISWKVPELSVHGNRHRTAAFLGLGKTSETIIPAAECSSDLKVHVWMLVTSQWLTMGELLNHSVAQLPPLPIGHNKHPPRWVSSCRVLRTVITPSMV